MARMMDDLAIRCDGGVEICAVKRGVRAASPEATVPAWQLPTELHADARRAALLDEIDEYVVALDWEYRCMHLNATAARLMSRDGDDLVGKCVWDVIPGLADSAQGKAIREAVELGRYCALELRSEISGEWIESRIYPTPSGVTLFGHEINERKRMELERESLLEALRDSEERHRELFQSESDAILLIDQESDRVLEANPAAEAMYGYTSDELLSMAALDLSAEPEASRETIRSLDVGQNAVVPSRLHRRKDGTAFPVEMTGRVFTLRGRPVRVAAIRDITARRRAEEVLGRFELLAANSRDIILFMDRDGRIIEVNEAAVRAYGYTRDELLELSIADLRVDRTKGQMAAQMAEADERGILFESLHRRKDGSAFPVEVSSRGASIGGRRTLVSVVRDIGERKRAEQAVQKSEQRYRTIVENAGEGIAIAGLDGAYTFVNRRFAEMLGYEVDELVGKLSRELAFEDRQPAAEETGDDRGSRRVTTGESRYRRKDGTVLWTQYSVTPLFDGDDVHVANLGLHTDVTDRHLAQEALRASEERFRELFEHMSQSASLSELVRGADGAPCDVRFLEVNPAFERLTGIKAVDAVQKTAHELYDVDAPLWLARYDEVVRTGRPAYFEERFEPLDRWLEVRAYRTGPDRFVALTADITERKRAEAALRESADTMRRLLAAADMLRRSLSLPEVLDRLAHLVLEACDHSRATISLWDGERRRIETLVSLGEPPVPIGTSVPLDCLSAPARQAIGERRPVLVDYDALAPGERGVGDHVASRLALDVPLHIGERLVGLLAVDDAGERGGTVGPAGRSRTGPSSRDHSPHHRDRGRPARHAGHGTAHPRRGGLTVRPEHGHDLPRRRGHRRARARRRLGLPARVPRQRFALHGRLRLRGGPRLPQRGAGADRGRPDGDGAGDRARDAPGHRTRRRRAREGLSRLAAGRP
jgi:PAS domain S-box-containing protein